MLDIGTNGELLLGNTERMLSASSPTGPAFEGAQIHHGMRAAPGAIERVRIDPATLAVTYRIIGNDVIEAFCKRKVREAGARGEEITTQFADSRQSTARRKRDALLNPALRAAGICGSGIIEAIAELFSRADRFNGCFALSLNTRGYALVLGMVAAKRPLC
ncbi:MAG: ASKHA domain-containing protein [Caldilineaceae bacterium]